jgi:hypothetical protein
LLLDKSMTERIEHAQPQPLETVPINLCHPRIKNNNEAKADGW